MHEMAAMFSEAEMKYYEALLEMDDFDDSEVATSTAVTSPTADTPVMRVKWSAPYLLRSEIDSAQSTTY